MVSLLFEISRMIYESEFSNMLKNKFIVIILLLFTLPLKGIAVNSHFKNSLNGVEVKKESLNKYSINLLFDGNYSEPLTIQQKGKNLYSIILPETKKTSETISILQNKNNEKVQLKIQEYPYLDQSINNGYVKIIVKTKDNVALKTTAIKGISKPQLPTPVVAKTIQTKPQNISNKQVQSTFAPIAKDEKNITQTKPTIDKATPPEVIESKNDTEINNIASIDEKPLKINYLDLMIEMALLLFITLISLRKIRSLFKKAKEREQFKFSTIKEKTSAEMNQGFKNEFEKLKEKEDELNKASSSDNEINTKIKLINEAKTPIKEEKVIEEQETAPPAPDLLSNISIAENKGFYLINYEDETALVGYINDEIFIINKFGTVKNCNLQTRLNEEKEGKSVYIVRLDDYKALVEVSDENMNLLVEY